MNRRRVIVAVAATGAVAVAAPAIAFWNLTSGSGNATFPAASLANPSTVGTMQTGPRALNVTWTSPSNPSGTVYVVKRTTDGSTICSVAAASPCADNSPLPGITNTYSIQAQLPSPSTWVAAGTPPTTTSGVMPDIFSVTSSTASPTAGASFNLTLTAQKWSTVSSALVTDTSYPASPHTIVFTGPSSSPAPISQAPTYTTSATFTSGVASGLATTLFKAESIAVTATEGSGNIAVSGTSPPLAVGGASPALIFSTSCSGFDTKKTGGQTNGRTTVTISRGTDRYANTVSDPNAASAITITLSGAPNGSWSPAGPVNLSGGVTTTGNETWTNSSSPGVPTAPTASATNYVSASCSYTTTNN